MLEQRREAGVEHWREAGGELEVVEAVAAVEVEADEAVAAGETADGTGVGTATLDLGWPAHLPARSLLRHLHRLR